MTVALASKAPIQELALPILKESPVSILYTGRFSDHGTYLLATKIVADLQEHLNLGYTISAEKPLITYIPTYCPTSPSDLPLTPMTRGTLSQSFAIPKLAAVSAPTTGRPCGI